MRWFVLVVLPWLVSACASEEVEPSAPQEESAARVSSTPALEHGALWWGTRVQSELSDQAPLHAFDFTLQARARVTLRLGPSALGPELDASLSLQRARADGSWARPFGRTALADTSFAQLSRTLGPGRYRALVRRGRVNAPFVLEASCDGERCASDPQASRCVFGTELSRLASQLELSVLQTITAATQLPDPLAHAQLTAASTALPEMQALPADVLFDQVDAGLVRWWLAWDRGSARRFRLFEFRVQGRSYGAAFVHGSMQPAARIVDGVFVGCQVAVGRCRFGTSYTELLEHAAFTQLENQRVTHATVAALSQPQQAELLRAVQLAYEEVEQLEPALSAVDQGEVRRTELLHRATGERYAVYEFGAGESTYGAVFAAESELVARIEDGALSDCTRLE